MIIKTIINGKYYREKLEYVKKTMMMKEPSSTDLLTDGIM